MGLMLDALKQIEVRSSEPVIVPLTQNEAAPISSRATEDNAHSEGGISGMEGPYAETDISIFSDTTIGTVPAEAAACDPWDRHPPFALREPLVWPECLAEHAPFHAKTAAAILHQLSRGTAPSDCFARRPTVVAVTSPGDGDGKTSTIVGLAPQLMQKLATALLVVDACRRKADLTEQFGLPTGQDAASGPAVIFSTCFPGLNVLPASCCLQGPSWMDDLRQTWPLVLLDTPSLSHPETGSLVCGCDGVYLVVRLGHTPRHHRASSKRSDFAVGWPPAGLHRHRIDAVFIARARSHYGSGLSTRRRAQIRPRRRGQSHFR